MPPCFFQVTALRDKLSETRAERAQAEHYRQVCWPSVVERLKHTRCASVTLIRGIARSPGAPDSVTSGDSALNPQVPQLITMLRDITANFESLSHK